MPWKHSEREKKEGNQVIENAVMVSTPVAENEEEYILTPWGCLSLVLNDYGIDTNGISGKAGAHVVEDFMELMVHLGYVHRRQEES